MKPVQLDLTLDEVNVILESLGSQPYARVYLLIAKINAQAVAQLERRTGEPEEG